MHTLLVRAGLDVGIYDRSIRNQACEPIDDPKADLR